MQDRPEDRVSDADARKGAVFDLARKAVATSVSALLQSEEGVRSAMAAVPREIAQYAARELAQLRGELLAALTGELSRFLDRVDPATELQKVLEGLTFDIRIQVSATPRTDQPEAGGTRDAPRGRTGASRKRGTRVTVSRKPS